MIPGYIKIFGSVLLSHSASRAVPSAQKSFTSVFEMGTGVASLPLPPKNFDNFDYRAIWITVQKERSNYRANCFAAKPHDLLVPVS